MGYFDNIVVPGGTTTPKKKGGYFDQISVPLNQARANNAFALEEEAIRAEREREEAQSISGTAKNAAIDFGNKMVKVPVDFLTSTWETYGQVGERVKKTTKDTVSEIGRAATAPGLNPLERVDAAKTTVSKATFRNAGDFVMGVFAPISGAIGAALNATGGTELVDNTGKVIADKSGITDVPAFQKFALEHPEAGVDFERLLNIVTLGGVKGKINPKEVTAQAEVVATKMVEPAPGTRKVPVNGESIETPVRFANEYQNPNDLPTIQAGARPKDTLPVIEADAPTPSTGSYSYEPIKSTYWDEIKAPGQVAESAPRVATEASTALPARTKQAVPEGEAVNSRAEKLLESAVSKGLIDDVGEVPTHLVKNMAEDLDRGFALIKRDRAIAEDIALGETRSPNVEKGSVYTALEIEAIEKGDVNLIMKLALSEAPTDAGRALKAFDSANPNSPVRIIRDINAERAVRVEKKAGAKPQKLKVEEMKGIEKSMEQAYSKRPTWEKFIDEISCNY